ncbi:DUF4430 domain-containing protein [Promicromonospora thailandica]|uniref:Transcobalamin-like C-terminal domain-containing protein n=1 Tax=Promicromonospora thailandica TaxID=765201 RepID=A0A9X2G9Z0_9MICO|nr:DUF4430 domain-containing protein [Promicromonospora thailandica]MCP2265884.1 protein of unknown function (DUF4430) [Promicromonospora thailandica]BFF21548.1 hypothetical protein GCM10025730_50690 [Promicromonospora thailandica]
MNTTSFRPFRAARVATSVVLAAGLGAGLLAGCGGGTSEPTSTAPPVMSERSASPSGSPSDDASRKPGADTFSYPGRTGSTALELLLEEDPSAELTGEGENAFVTAINGRVADEAENEFWSLSVDGVPAQVGAGMLDTEDGQEITWTIETY